MSDHGLFSSYERRKEQRTGEVRVAFSRMRGSTIGEGGDTTISSPGRSPKQPLPGI